MTPIQAVQKESKQTVLFALTKVGMETGGMILTFLPEERQDHPGQAITCNQVLLLVIMEFLLVQKIQKAVLQSISHRMVRAGSMKHFITQNQRWVQMMGLKNHEL